MDHLHKLWVEGTTSQEIPKTLILNPKQEGTVVARVFAQWACNNRKCSVSEQLFRFSITLASKSLLFESTWERHDTCKIKTQS